MPNDSSRRAGSWWAALGTAGTVLTPFLVWPLFLLMARRTKITARGWEVLWAGYFLGLAVPYAFAGDIRALGLVALESIGGYLACRLFTTPAASVRLGLSFALAVVAFGSLIEAGIYERTWKAPGEHPRAAIEWRALRGVDRIDRPASYRLWSLPDGSGSLTLSFEARREGGEAEASWRRSTADVNQEQVTEDGRPATRLDIPTAGDPWVAQDYVVDDEASALRVMLDARAEPAAAGRLYILVNGQPLHVEEVDVSEHWESYSATWNLNAPKDLDTITVQLNDFDGRVLFVRGVEVQRLEPGAVWQSLGPPRQEIATLAVDFADRATSLSQERADFLPSREWQRMESVFTSEALQESRASGELSSARTILRLPEDMVVLVRNVRLKDGETGATASPRSALPRQQLWYGHPNIMGHAVAVAGMAVVAASPFHISSIFGLALAFVAAWLSGGRAALVVLGLAVPFLALIQPHAAQRLRLLAIAALVVVAAAGALFVTSEGALRTAAGQTPRAVIVSTAVDIIRENLWTGIGDDRAAFQAAWQTSAGAASDGVSHAHNWWLHLGVVSGVPGLVAALWFSTGLLVIGWEAGRWVGVSFVASVLALQTVDVTMMHWAILYPLVLTLNALARRRTLAVLGQLAHDPGGA